MHTYVLTRNFWAFLWLATLSLLVLANFSPAYAAAQGDDPPGDPSEAIVSIQEAIEDGNAEQVTRLASSYVEVTVSGATSMHSRAQTAYILKAFFRDCPPADFSFERRTSLGNDWFIYGNYRCRGENRPYRLEVLLRWSGRQYEIKTIRFEQINR